MYIRPDISENACQAGEQHTADKQCMQLAPAIGSQTFQQAEGIKPWMQIGLDLANNKSVCETLLIEEWEKVVT
jgi:hypothetical protein